MFCYREPQPQVVKNHSYLFNLRPNIYKYRCLNSHFILNNSRLKTKIIVISRQRVKVWNTTTRLPARRRAIFWHRFFKHTISSLSQHTSATTCAIGNAIFFKTVSFPSHRSSRRPSRLTCGLTCSCCVGRRISRRVGVSRRVACLIALALTLVCFALTQLCYQAKLYFEGLISNHLPIFWYRIASQ